MVENLIVVVLVALAVLTAVRYFGGQTARKYRCAGEAVDRMGGAPAAPGCAGAAPAPPGASPPEALPDVPGPPPVTPTPTPGDCSGQYSACMGSCSGDVLCRLRCGGLRDICENPDSCQGQATICQWVGCQSLFATLRALEQAAQAAVAVAGQQLAMVDPSDTVAFQAALARLAEAEQGLAVTTEQVTQQGAACYHQCADAYQACVAAANPP